MATFVAVTELKLQEIPDKVVQEREKKWTINDKKTEYICVSMGNEKMRTTETKMTESIKYRTNSEGVLTD